MRSQFLLVPAALIAAAPAQAHQFVSLKDGLARMFPGAKLTPADYVMEIAEVAALMQAIDDESVYRYTIKAWKVATGGWIFLDQVTARGYSTIVYLVGVNPDGTVKGIEVLECDPNYNQVLNPKWRQQFEGKRKGETPTLSTVARASGATLSCQGIAVGVRRVIAAYELFFAPKGG